MQSAKHSLYEVLTNIGSGFILSALVQHYVVVPVWHLQTTPGDSIAITVLFTAISIVRSYFFRRIFNKLGNK